MFFILLVAVVVVILYGIGPPWGYGDKEGTPFLSGVADE
jgi:hypothetical protein